VEIEGETEGDIERSEESKKKIYEYVMSYFS
jgi:hypothetical protein